MYDTKVALKFIATYGAESKLSNFIDWAIYNRQIRAIDVEDLVLIAGVFLHENYSKIVLEKYPRLSESLAQFLYDRKKANKLI